MKDEIRKGEGKNGAMKSHRVPLSVSILHPFRGRTGTTHPGRPCLFFWPGGVPPSGRRLPVRYVEDDLARRVIV